MIIDNKISEFIAHEYAFFDFWSLNCEGKETPCQLQIIYKESFIWFARILSSALTEKNKKVYALFISKEGKGILKKRYPNEYNGQRTIGKFLKNKDFDIDCYYIVFSIIYANECITSERGTMSLFNALERSLRCDELKDKLFELGLQLVKSQESKIGKLRNIGMLQRV